MKNIFQIFYHDIKKIRKNVIALIVILGITIVPSLYAWFNIAASWDLNCMKIHNSIGFSQMQRMLKKESSQDVTMQH